MDRSVGGAYASPMRTTRFVGGSRQRRDGFTQVKLPNGLVIDALNAGEATFLYEEIFDRGTYLRTGLQLSDGATVLDVGANIGMFALSLAQTYANLRLVLFEPVPATFAVLERNAARLLTNADVVLRREGMAAAPGRVVFDVDPRWSLDAGYRNRDLTASARRDAGADAWTRALLHDAQRAGRLSTTAAARLGRALKSPVTRPAVVGLVWLAGRIRTAQRRRENRSVECDMTTISSALDDHDLDVVDLVKIDVEGAEWEVFGGIQESDWPRLHQFVVEVHDIHGRLARVRDLLESNGFLVTVEEADWELLRLMRVCMLYARRP
jgi:FkbM family methyltransferase